MTNLKSQPDFNSRSNIEIKRILRQLLPSLEKLVSVAKDFCSQKTHARISSPCESCSKKNNCIEPCKDLKKALQKINSGRSKHENLTGFYEGTLKEIQKTRDVNVFHDYEACKHLFTRKQWIIISQYWQEGKTITEIAGQLNRKPQTVSEHLKKAAIKKEDYDRNLRLEKLEYLRKKLNEENP